MCDDEKNIERTLCSLLIKSQSRERHSLISSGSFTSITTLFSYVFSFSTESVRGRFFVRTELSSWATRGESRTACRSDSVDLLAPVAVVVVDDESWLSSAVCNEFWEIVSPEPIVERFFDPPDFFESLFFLKMTLHQSTKRNATKRRFLTSRRSFWRTTLRFCPFVFVKRRPVPRCPTWRGNVRGENSSKLHFSLFVPAVVMNVVLPFVCFLVEFCVDDLNERLAIERTRKDRLWLCKFDLDVMRRRARLEELVRVAKAKVLSSTEGHTDVELRFGGHPLKGKDRSEMRWKDFCWYHLWSV